MMLVIHELEVLVLISENARRAAAELRTIPDLTIFNTENAAALPEGDKEKPTGPALTIAQAQGALRRTSGLAPPTQIGGSP